MGMPLTCTCGNSWDGEAWGYVICPACWAEMPWEPEEEEEPPRDDLRERLETLEGEFGRWRRQRRGKR